MRKKYLKPCSVRNGKKTKQFILKKYTNLPFNMNDSHLIKKNEKKTNNNSDKPKWMKTKCFFDKIKNKKKRNGTKKWQVEALINNT